MTARCAEIIQLRAYDQDRHRVREVARQLAQDLFRTVEVATPDGVVIMVVEPVPAKEGDL